MAIPKSVRIIAIVGIVLEGLLLVGVPTLCLFRQARDSPSPAEGSKYVAICPYSRDGTYFKNALTRLPADINVLGFCWKLDEQDEKESYQYSRFLRYGSVNYPQMFFHFVMNREAEYKGNQTKWEDATFPGKFFYGCWEWIWTLFLTLLKLVIFVLPLLATFVVVWTLQQIIFGKPAAAEEIFPSVGNMKAITAYAAIAKVLFTILAAYLIVRPHIRGTLAEHAQNWRGEAGVLDGYFQPLFAVTIFNWMFYIQLAMIVLYFVADKMQSSEAEPEAEEEKPAEAAADAQQTAENADQVTIDVAPENEEAKPIVEDEAVKSEPEAQDEAIVEAVEAVQDEAVVEAVIAQDEAVEADQAQDVAVEAPQEAEAVEAPVEAQAEQVVDVAAPEPEAEIEAPVAEEAPAAVEAPVEAPVEEAIEEVREAPAVSADNINFDDAADLPAPEVFPQVE